MTDPIDAREISGCTCLRVRHVARQLTQSYDQALAPLGLTLNQFGLLATLHGVTQASLAGLPIGVFADRVGMHPTTLNRDLKPLKAQNLVADAVEAGDRRVRAVILTSKGQARLHKAVPLWRRAQRRLEGALGAEATRALNDLLELASVKLRS